MYATFENHYTSHRFQSTSERTWPTNRKQYEFQLPVSNTCQFHPPNRLEIPELGSVHICRCKLKKCEAYITQHVSKYLRNILNGSMHLAFVHPTNMEENANDHPTSARRYNAKATMQARPATCRLNMSQTTPSTCVPFQYSGAHAARLGCVGARISGRNILTAGPHVLLRGRGSISFACAPQHLQRPGLPKRILRAPGARSRRDPFKNCEVIRSEPGRTRENTSAGATGLPRGWQHPTLLSIGHTCDRQMASFAQLHP